MEQLTPINGKKKLFLKTDLPALLAFILFAGLIFFYLIPGFENAMMERKRTLIKEMTSSAYSLIEYYYSLENKGILDSTEARIQAKNAIGNIRYGEQLKDYFWITDRKPVMIMHPYRKELNGNDLSAFEDSKGKLIFVEFARAVSQTGESYVEYMWQWNDDSTTVVPKLSYVKLFEPWNWIIGTGIYIEDVKTEIRKVEFRALVISGIIGIIIIILLSIVTRQSHKIEQKRKKTEEELFRSRELYRTLAEAATEGVLIWTRDGIQSNKTLLSILGYSEEELREKSVDEIFSSSDIDILSGPDNAYDNLGFPQYGECEIKSSDGSSIKAHSGYSRILLGENKAVVILIRPVKQHSSSHEFTLPHVILDSIQTGFFRISFGRKTRFLDATDPVLKMLGFDNLDDLLQFNAESLFVNQGQLRLLKKNLASRVAVSDMVMTIANKSGIRFEALISIMVVDQQFPEIWCEGSIEYLTADSTAIDVTQTVPPQYYFSFLQNAPVRTIMVLPEECSYNTTLSDALEIMIENNSQAVIVKNTHGDPAGIVELSFVVSKLAKGESAGMETGKLLASSPDFIGIDKPVTFAFELMYLQGKKPLLVKSTDGKLAGIITEREILKNIFMSDSNILNMANQAASVSELKNIADMARNMSISMILGKIDPLTISSFISTTADIICTRVIELSISDLGPPPARFAFIQTGSAGRKEQTLVTDQDNGIIFEDCGEAKLSEAQKYFPKLGRRINELLTITGYNLCKGNNMAGNVKWSQPLSVWKEYFSGWIRIPEPTSLLDISIFFDFRHCFGDDGLTRELRSYVNHNLVTNDIYFYHYTSALKQYQPSPVREGTRAADIKRILMPLNGLIRMYSLKYGIDTYSTSSRILALHENGYLDAVILREMFRSLKYLSSIRLSHQADCLNKGKEPDNLIDFSFAEVNSLYFTNLAIESINNLMLKAATDFHANEL
ncbi:MAG TPA: cache domain-containing protein [Bacteroidales bacterium]|nr:cache domain-containing protein [Bacteroidales bacterium]